MDRHRRWSTVLATVMAGAMLLAATAAPALAGDTRNVFVGSPGGADGALAFTPVSVGQLTKADVLIFNDGTATMNKTTLSIGTSPAAALPSGVTLDGIYLPNGSKCPGDASGAVCSFGNLAGGATRTVAVVIRVSAAVTALPENFLTVKVKETVNDNGANTDTFKASATINAEAASCDGVVGFIAPNASGHITTVGATCDPQSTSLLIAAKAGGSLARISEAADSTCAGSLTCFGLASEANVNDGAPIALKWTITWNVAALPKSFNVKKAGVIHYDSAGTDIITASKDQCGNSATKTNCIESVTLTSTTLTIVFRTPDNGKVRGFG